MTLLVSRVDRALCGIERSVALLSRCRPRNLLEEMAVVREQWRRGNPVAPKFTYAAAPDVREVRRWLDGLVERVRPWGRWGDLYADRARELAEEAALLEQIGAAEFFRFAGRRYPIDRGFHGRRADRWARAWSRRPAGAGQGATHRSDDERDPWSLVSAMRRAVGERRLSWRVVLEDRLQSAAATTDAAILIRSGELYTRRAVERIVSHEIVGHVLPRTQAALDPIGLCRTASAGGCDDEEGRALLIECRAGLWDAERRAVLGWRHLAACAVREGAEWQEVVRLLLGMGALLDQSLDIAARVSRGGGLGREIVYLPGLSRVGLHLKRSRALEGWMKRGRIGVQAAAELDRLGPPPGDCVGAGPATGILG